MLSPDDFVEELVNVGITRFTGVPCSFFQAAINRVLDDKRLSYTIAPNEGSALALAAGAQLSGYPAAVLIQNSGFGNLINPLTSLNMIYGIPALIFMSGRNYGVPDEPQHEVMGQAMVPLLNALKIPHMDLPAERTEYSAALAQATQKMQATKQPFFFLVRKGCVEEYSSDKKTGQWPLSRIEAIRVIGQVLEGSEVVVATTGKPSRELFSVFDRAKNFYMQGSMGHASSIGFGVAMNSPKKRVVVLDGDGAAIMHLGALSMVGHYKPANLLHIILDNEAYETTGNQDTTSSTTDLTVVAKACGYLHSEEVKDEAGIRARLKFLLKEKGPSFLRIKINRKSTPSVPRISEKYSSRDVTKNFSAALKGAK